MPENTDDDETLTLDEAYRAAFHFINQYYERERSDRFFLMLDSMRPWREEANFSRDTSDPATWSDWLGAVETARKSELVPDLVTPTVGRQVTAQIDAEHGYPAALETGSMTPTSRSAIESNRIFPSAPSDALGDNDQA